MESSSSNIFVPKKDSTANWIPEGFVLLIGPDEEKYIVPEFLVDSIDQDYYSYKKKKKLSGAPGTVSFRILYYTGDEKCPAAPAHYRHLTNNFGRFLQT
jgi:hypothetical protein